MKKLFLLGFSLFALSASAQSIERQVIGSTGGNFTGSIQLDWTVGEVVINTATAGSVILTQGFQQPPAAVNSIKSLQKISDVIVSPNPTDGFIKVEWKTTVFTGNLTIYDATGRVVWNSHQQAIKSTPIDISKLSPGIYNLQISGTDNQISVQRITKI